MQQSPLFQEMQGSLSLEGSRVFFTLRQNKRIKRGRLLISPEEGLVVETKGKASLKRAQNMIARRSAWVLKTLNSIQEQRELAKRIESSDHIWVLGKEKSLRIRRGQKKDYILETKEHIILGFEAFRVSKDKINTTLRNWLTKRAERYLPVRVRALNQKRFAFNKVFIKNQKNLWGSCSSDKNLNLNWRLIMAPRFASDYIILHELCHIKHLNHSDRFWKLVESVCPEYKKAEKWFDDFGFMLHLKPR